MKRERRRKAVLNRTKHPTYIGPLMVERAARNGGAFLFSHRGEDIAVAIMQTRTATLLAMSVVREHQRHGMPRAILRYTTPSWLRVITQWVPMCRMLGYVEVGSPIEGRKLATHTMVRRELLTLAGRISGSAQTRDALADRLRRIPSRA